MVKTQKLKNFQIFYLQLTQWIIQSKGHLANDINLKNYLKKNDLIYSNFFYGNKFGKVNIDKRTSYSGDQVFFFNLSRRD